MWTRMWSDSTNYFFPSYYNCVDANVTPSNDDSEQAETMVRTYKQWTYSSGMAIL